jgi:nickel-dependent lactate racemase
LRFQLQSESKSHSIEVSSHRLAGSFRGPAGPALSNLHRTLIGRLAKPLEAPAWNLSLVEGDCLAVAVDGSLANHASALLSSAIHWLEQSQVSLGRVEVIFTPGVSGGRIEEVQAELKRLPIEVNVSCHDPDNAKEHAYLASMADGRRVYLSKRFADADTMLVIGRSGFDANVGLGGPMTTLYPGLANTEAWDRCRKSAVDRSLRDDSLRKRIGSEEVAWLSGVFYAMAVATDRDDRIVDLWIGKFHEVQESADRHAREHWTVDAGEEAADLVIAALTPGEGPARWSGVGAALEAATGLAGADARIALVADLAEPPGPSGQWLTKSENPWDVLAQVRTATEPDIVETAQIAHALSASRVHLLSRLETELVERLGMIPILSEKELQNLVDHAKRCFVMEDADRARVSRRG